MAEYLCPHCKKVIYDDEALLCHFCGESLGRGSRGALGKTKGVPGKWVTLAIVLIMLISFAILFLK